MLIPSRLAAHTVHMGSKGIRRRKPRHKVAPLRSASGEAGPLLAGAPDEYSTITPYGAAMGMATFVGKLIERITHKRRR